MKELIIEFVPYLLPTIFLFVWFLIAVAYILKDNEACKAENYDDDRIEVEFDKFYD